MAPAAATGCDDEGQYINRLWGAVLQKLSDR
jgi:hypothetical protein